jgi:hypothetical protein
MVAVMGAKGKPGSKRPGWEEEVMRALADSGVLWILVFTALPVLYLLPTLVGAIRRVDRLALVFLVNLIGAPTGVGWVAAMILAFGPRRPSPAPPSTAPWTPSAYRAYWRDAR